MRYVPGLVDHLTDQAKDQTGRAPQGFDSVVVHTRDDCSIKATISVHHYCWGRVVCLNLVSSDPTPGAPPFTQLTSLSALHTKANE